MSFIVKTTQCSKAIVEYQKATKKDMVYVLNRTLRNVGFRAAEFTPKKLPSTIEVELRKDKLALKIVTKKLVGKRGGSYRAKKGGGRVRGIKQKGKGGGYVTRKQISLRTRQFIKRRQKRTGFLRAGWVAALIASGVVTNVPRSTLIRDGKSTIGSGKAATANHLRAYLGNAVWGRLTGKAAGQTRGVMQQALNRAMSFVADDMTKYAWGKMRETARKFSGKKK